MFLSFGTACLPELRSKDLHSVLRVWIQQSSDFIGNWHAAELGKTKRHVLTQACARGDALFRQGDRGTSWRGPEGAVRAETEGLRCAGQTIIPIMARKVGIHDGGGIAEAKSVVWRLFTICCESLSAEWAQQNTDHEQFFSSLGYR
jgi:hypothetical protein